MKKLNIYSILLVGILFLLEAQADSKKPTYKEYDPVRYLYPTKFTAKIEKQENIPISRNEFEIVVNDGFFKEISVLSDSAKIVSFEMLETYMREAQLELKYPLISTLGIEELAKLYPKRLVLYHFDLKEKGVFRIYLKDMITGQKYFVSSIELDWKSKTSNKRKMKIYALYNSLGKYLRGL